METYTKIKISRAYGKFESLFKKAIWILILLLAAYFIINISSYWDPLRMCYIKIEGDILRGNENTIQKAIVYIKNRDDSSYKNLCKYVDVISEKQCAAYDPRVETGRTDSEFKDSCFVKGSKNIYIKSTKEVSEEIVQRRAEEIIRMTNFSVEFWKNKYGR